MSDTTAGLLQAGALVARARCLLPPAGRVPRPRSDRREGPPGRASGLPPGRRRPEGRPAVGDVRRLAARLLVRRRPPAVRRSSGRSRDLPAVPGLPRGGTRPLAFNTAASFVTNTNWQAYSGEATMGHLTQMAGLAVQNFVSAAVGHLGGRRPDPRLLPVPLRAASATSGSTSCARPCASSCRSPSSPPSPWSRWGSCRTLGSGTDATTLTGGHQTIPGGPVASQEAIKELGTNGGGFYNAELRAPVREPEPAVQPGSRTSCCC